jgi:hypothetical protein
VASWLEAPLPVTFPRVAEKYKESLMTSQEDDAEKPCSGCWEDQRWPKLQTEWKTVSW